MQYNDSMKDMKYSRFQMATEAYCHMLLRS